MQRKRSARFVALFLVFILAASMMTVTSFAAENNDSNTPGYYWTSDIEITGFNAVTLADINAAIAALNQAIMNFAGPQPYQPVVGGRQRGGDPNPGTGITAAELIQRVTAIDGITDGTTIREYSLAISLAGFQNSGSGRNPNNAFFTSGEVSTFRQMGSTVFPAQTQASFRASTNGQNHPMVKLMELLKTIQNEQGNTSANPVFNRILSIDGITNEGIIRDYSFSVSLAGFQNSGSGRNPNNAFFTSGEISTLRQMGSTVFPAQTQASFRASTNGQTHPMVKLMNELRAIQSGN